MGGRTSGRKPRLGRRKRRPPSSGGLTPRLALWYTPSAAPTSGEVRPSCWRPKTHGGTAMLMLSRKVDEAIVIAGKVRVVVAGVSRRSVRLGVQAPRDVAVDREEIYLLKQCLGRGPPAVFTHSKSTTCWPTTRVVWRRCSSGGRCMCGKGSSRLLLSGSPRAGGFNIPRPFCFQPPRVPHGLASRGLSLTSSTPAGLCFSGSRVPCRSFSLPHQHNHRRDGGLMPGGCSSRRLLGWSNRPADERAVLLLVPRPPCFHQPTASRGEFEFDLHPEFVGRPQEHRRRAAVVTTRRRCLPIQLFRPEHHEARGDQSGEAQEPVPRIPNLPTLVSQRKSSKWMLPRSNAWLRAISMPFQ
jgi:carbon storage regulator